jgi:hypothetical protein
MSKDFTVTVTNPDRAADWQSILGRATVSVLSPLPSRGNLPGHPDALFYMLDLDALTSEEIDRLTAFIAQRFHIADAEVAHDLRRNGVPILADDCIVSVHLNPQRWFD